MAEPSGSSRGGSAETEACEVPFSMDNYFKIGNVGGPSEGTPKKRGPKPDQKPAKNEKIERNRKAQRSHRERKERYIRNLEQELKRLREAYTAAIGEKATIVEENRQLHAILKQHGINFPYLGPIHGQTMVPVGAAPVATQGIAQPQFGHHYEHDCSQHRHDHNHHVHSYPSPPQLDLSIVRGQVTALSGQQITVEQYSQIAINLVLALEKLCLDHIQKLSTLSHHNSDYIQGHVLMVSCPPKSHTMANPGQDWGLRTVDLDPEPLGTLFNMQVLDAERKQYLEGLDGELTPMAAWTKITTHPRFHELTLQDFETLTLVLPGRASCHGFGAVIEEAEVEDTMDALFAAKDDRA